ncbi:MAG: hypothetical protein VXZ43_11955, partial [Pseudomonadota bacterium]|nr:hypothetical protein [Pseudomonadota bacterium]
QRLRPNVNSVVNGAAELHSDTFAWSDAPLTAVRHIRYTQLELRVTRAALISARTSAVDARLARVQAEIELARQDGRAPFQGAQ